MRCSRDLAVHREMVEEAGNVGLTEGGWMPLAAEEDEAPYPMHIRLLGAVAIMLLADGFAQRLQQAGRAFGIDGAGIRHTTLLERLTPMLANVLIM